MGSLSLSIPDSMHQKVREIAKKEKVSINQFISSAVSEKLSAFMTEEYLHKRAKRGSRDLFLKALAQVPEVEPEENDRF